MDSPLASLSLLSRSLSSHFVRLGLGFVVSYYLGFGLRQATRRLSGSLWEKRAATLS